ncbi:hypothetical protein IF1G_08936 [Cordyceps javanica]|uniref:Uncharacterized protein n=1 Tax=Cordyceps javanica TaxID=43265 RepID=A0A545USG5_9HYPO|nr:hypothetical protein IF1G_08936 [Cordyceps javanica]
MLSTPYISLISLSLRVGRAVLNGFSAILWLQFYKLSLGSRVRSEHESRSASNFGVALLGYAPATIRRIQSLLLGSQSLSAIPIVTISHFTLMPISAAKHFPLVSTLGPDTHICLDLINDVRSLQMGQAREGKHLYT